MTKRFGAIVILLVLLGVGIFFARYYKLSHGTASQQVSVLDRVRTASTLRCGYVSYPPYVQKDPNTGKISRITVDYLEKTAARSGIKIDWTAEISIDQLFPSLNFDRIDMFCVPCSPSPDWGAHVNIVGSFGQLPYYVYVPQHSQKSQEELQAAHFVVSDGYIPSVETTHYFPKATVTSLPQTASIAELYDQLKYGKADAAVNEHVSALNYMKGNPDTIKRLSDQPLFTKTMAFPVKKNDPRWSDFVRQMTDTTLPENQALFRELTERYGLIGNALLY